MTEDSAGFYSKLGFANIDESVLTVEYTFSYTSGGGMAKRKFTVPMTEETIVDLIEALEGKLTISAFTKEQRALMTNKLREHIKERDHFTCCSCGNSIYAEPNLLLEINISFLCPKAVIRQKKICKRYAGNATEPKATKYRI